MCYLSKKLSLAYWPDPAANESANRELGNAVVDACTIGQLTQFYKECDSGPTYCVVTERVQELLKKFPPRIEEKRERVQMALYAAEIAYQSLKQAAESALRTESIDAEEIAVIRKAMEARYGYPQARQLDHHERAVAANVLVKLK